MNVNGIRSKDVGYKSYNSDENEKKSGKFSDNNDYLDIWRVNPRYRVIDVKTFIIKGGVSITTSSMEFQDFSMTNKFSRSIYDNTIETYSLPDKQVLALLSKEYQTILDIINNHRITNMEQAIAIKAKLIELNNSKIIEEDLIDGNKAWRLSNY